MVLSEPGSRTPRNRGFMWLDEKLVRGGYVTDTPVRIL